MRNVRVETLEHISLQDMTEMWNRCWHGYYYDMSYSQEHMKLWLNLSQVSMQHSMAIFVNDLAVGFALLSVDESEGWIAGACIDPHYRRNGLFTELMRAQLNMAKHVHLKRIYLEVLEQNHACLVYQSVGFRCIRKLNLYRLQSKGDLGRKQFEICPLIVIPLEQYFESRSLAFFNPAWQRREKYLRRYSNLLAMTNSGRTAGALFAGEKSGPLLDIWSATFEGAEELLPTLLQGSSDSLSLKNQPNDWISSFLGTHNINSSAKQFEMCVELS